MADPDETLQGDLGDPSDGHETSDVEPSPPVPWWWGSQFKNSL